MIAKIKTADHCRRRAASAVENEAACLNATLREEWSMIAQEWTSFAIMMERREARMRAQP
jgi:hypothetical protein